MTKKATAPSAEAGAVAPASAAKASKPAHHLPTQRRPRDEFTGLGGTYTRNPETGERTKVQPPAAASAAAEEEDTAEA
jgi:hypothetical protein